MVEVLEELDCCVEGAGISTCGSAVVLVLEEELLGLILIGMICASCLCCGGMVCCWRGGWGGVGCCWGPSCGWLAWLGGVLSSSSFFAHLCGPPHMILFLKWHAYKATALVRIFILLKPVFHLSPRISLPVHFFLKEPGFNLGANENMDSPRNPADSLTVHFPFGLANAGFYYKKENGLVATFGRFQSIDMDLPLTSLAARSKQSIFSEKNLG